jgi:hypothetical protein
MRNSSKILVVIAAVAAIAIIASVMKLGKSGGGSTVVQPTNEDRTVQAPQPPEASSNSKIKEVVRVIPRAVQPTQGPIFPRPTNENSVVPKVTPAQMTDWDEKVSDVLGAEGDEKDKAKKLIDMFPQLPPEGQEEVAHHLSNLVADEDYAPLSNFVTNSALPEAVLDVFVEDVFNRPNAIKLPVLLDIAQDPQHPRASEAKDVLELFLEEDFGSDWTKWHTKMDKWLKDNPD